METMETLAEFRQRVTDSLARISSEYLSYNEEEYWMIRSPYEFIEHYAEKHRLFNTAIALPLARGLHNGSYRKTPMIRGGVGHRPPYVIHCLTVTKMLADMWLPISKEEEDLLLAASLLHDSLEDVAFPEDGREFMTQFSLDPKVYETVKTVTKRKDFTLEEEQAFFRHINENRDALLIKLSDRGHNVTDLYSMSQAKIREYITETRTYFMPMCEYAREHYPELEPVIEIMQDQLVCLTKTVEMTAEIHEERQAQMNKDLKALTRENERLRAKWDKMRAEV